MNELTLTHQQIFTLKPETLETRIMTYYQETQNSSLTIKYIMALPSVLDLVRRSSRTFSAILSAICL
jgi:hypothetical protein